MSEEKNLNSLSMLASLGDADSMKEAMPELASIFIPKMQILFPIVERKLIDFIDNHNGLVIIKKEKDGSISANIFDRSKMIVDYKKKKDENGSYIQKKDAEGNLLLDDKGNPIFEKYSGAESIAYTKEGNAMTYNIKSLRELIKGDNFENWLKNMDFSKIVE